MMMDPVGTSISAINTIIMFAGIIICLYGQLYFKEGILVKTARRAAVVSSILFLHFFLNTMRGYSLLTFPDIVGEFLEFCFTIGLVNMAYGYLHDWQKLGESTT
jgi:hypothetical protein